MKLLPALFLALALLAQEIIPLPITSAPNTSSSAEHIENRGKAGAIGRSITNVSQPTITVYLPPKETPPVTRGRVTRSN